MPRKDGTGPVGQGSQTGRRMGNCVSQSDNTQVKTWGMGRSCGRRFSNQSAGRRYRYFRTGYFNSFNKNYVEDNYDDLIQEQKELEARLHQIKELIEKNNSK